MRLSIPRTLAVLAILAVASSVARAQAPAPTTSADPAKAALLHELLVRTHAVEQSMSVLDATIASQRAVPSRIPAVFWDRFQARAHARQDELEAMIAAVYDRHFTTDELRQLLAFYDTPVGKKLLTTLPTIVQESMAAGREWGGRLGAAVGQELTAEGVRLEP